MNAEPLFLIPGTWDEWRHWFAGHGPDIAGIVVGLVVARFVFHRVFARILREAAARAARVRREDPAALRGRADTLLATLDWGFTVFLVFVGSALLLDQFEIQASALVAGVGVIGVAIGLGTQTLVRDVINGVFILVEGQYAVGDTVSVGGATGEVIEINPRRTVVRDDEGNIHSIPSGTLTVAVNRTPALGRLRVEVEVHFRDGEEATRLATEVCAEMAAESSTALIVPPRVGVQKMVDHGDMRLVIVGETRPTERWRAESDLRRRVKRRFDTEGIEMRFAGAADTTRHA